MSDGNGYKRRGPPPAGKGGTLTMPRSVLDAERAVLGCAMLDDAVARELCDAVGPEDFCHEGHRTMFKAIRRVLERDRGADVVTVGEALREEGKLQTLVGIDREVGMAYITRCVEAVATTAHSKYYSHLVKEASYDRQLVTQAHQFLQEKTPEAIRRMHDTMVALAGVRHDRVLDFRKDLPALLDELQNKAAPAIDLGIPGLDAALAGTEPGDVLTVGARTNGGKTAIMTKSFYGLGCRGIEALYITTEMTREQMALRVLPMAARVPAWKFRRRKLDAADWARLNEACASRLSKLPLKIYGKSVVSLEDIRSATSQSKAKVVYIDYLQRCRYPKGDVRAYQVMDFMIGLKEFALDAGVVAVIACQLARGMDKAPDAEPDNADLKDSGAIEAESDQVALFWKPTDKQLQKDPGYVPPLPHEVRMRGKVSKNRHGRAGDKRDMTMDTMLVEICAKEEKPDIEREPEQGALALAGGEGDAH